MGGDLSLWYLIEKEKSFEVCERFSRDLAKVEDVMTEINGSCGGKKPVKGCC